MKRIPSAIGAVLVIATGLSAAPGYAMGTGNPYEDQQAGVSYTVYQPSYTAGLKTPPTGSGQAECPAGTDQDLGVSYGKKAALHFTVTEGNPLCSDVGSGPTVLTTTIKGARATVQAYCDPAKVKICTKADVLKYGGHLSVTLPAIKGLTKTMVVIETTGKQKLSAQQLVLVARSMKPVN